MRERIRSEVCLIRTRLDHVDSHSARLSGHAPTAAATAWTVVVVMQERGEEVVVEDSCESLQTTIASQHAVNRRVAARYVFTNARHAYYGTGTSVLTCRELTMCACRFRRESKM